MADSGIATVADNDPTVGGESQHDAHVVPLLVLWDVDHTLIENGGVSKSTYRRAFEMVTGTQPVHAVETDGRTDMLIMRSLFERHGIEATDALLAMAASALPEALSSLADRLGEVGHALPGAQAALSALSAEPGVLQSTLTGNVVANAYTKLAAFGLHQHLDLEIGGYGSDAEIRSDLVEVARRRATTKYGFAFTGANTVLIGDTVRDVQATSAARMSSASRAARRRWTNSAQPARTPCSPTWSTPPRSWTRSSPCADEMHSSNSRTAAERA